MTWVAARLVAAREDDAESGVTLVEVLVAIAIVVTGMLGMLGELVNYARSSQHARTEATAERLATGTSESARLLPYGQLLGLVTASQPAASQVVDGTTYTITQTLQRCAASDGVGSCTTPAPLAPDTVRVGVVVSWLEGGRSHTVQTASSVTDDSVVLVDASGAGTIASLLGGSATAGLTATVSSFTVSPASIGVGADGHPSGPVTLTLSGIGIQAGSWFPATWSDDTGSHQASLMATGANTWSATVAASQITRVVPAGQSTASVVFAATVPGTRAVPTTTLTLLPAPSFTQPCTVFASPVLLKVLTTTTAAAESLSCTTAGMTAAGDVSVSFPAASGSTTGHLTSTNGSTWTLTLPAGTSLKGPLTEPFTFTPKRADGMLGAAQTVTAVLL